MGDLLGDFERAAVLEVCGDDGRAKGRFGSRCPPGGRAASDDAVGVLVPYGSAAQYSSFSGHRLEQRLIRIAG